MRLELTIKLYSCHNINMKFLVVVAPPYIYHVLTTSNWTKNTFIVDKFPPKHLDIQSNKITSIHRHVKVKRPKNIQKKSYRKMEATKLYAIMEQLEKLDVNGHHRRNNINHFAPLYESDDNEDTRHGTKPKI